MKVNLSQLRHELELLEREISDLKAFFQHAPKFGNDSFFDPSAAKDRSEFMFQSIFLIGASGLLSYVFFSTLALFLRLVFSNFSAEIDFFYLASPGAFIGGLQCFRAWQTLRNDPEYLNNLAKNKSRLKYAEQRRLELIGMISKESIRLRDIERKKFQLTEDYWKALSDVKLELAVSAMLSDVGYSTKTTKASGDGGIDVIAENSEVALYIQCKGWAKPVGAPVIREIAGVVSSIRAQKPVKGVVVCPNGFTKSAREFAENASVFLWDCTHLSAMAHRVLITIETD